MGATLGVGAGMDWRSQQCLLAPSEACRSVSGLCPMWARIGSRPALTRHMGCSGDKIVLVLLQLHLGGEMDIE